MTPIPPEIRDLDGRRIAIRGFVVPVDQEAEGTNRFVLLNCALACCYGKMPKPNEWIDVTVKGGERISLAIDQPAWAFGRLEVREEIEDGTLVGLYWMEADEVRIDTAS